MAEKEMTFWEHLDELRRVIFHSLIVLLVVFAVLFFFKGFLFDTIIFAPAREDFYLYGIIDYFSRLIGGKPLEPFHLEIINIELAAQFFLHLSTTFYFALVITMPFIIYKLWTFVSPALYPKERAAVQRAFSFSALLFYMGVAVGYFLVFPLTIRFLGTYHVSESVPNEIALRSYISMFVSLILIMGIVFELPTLAAILSRIGVITKELLKKYRRHAFVILIIVAAIITPSGDPFTLMAVGLPLYALYEVSIAVCKNRRREDDNS